MLHTKSLRAVLITALVFSSVSAFAAECALNITRTACPGQERESFSKWDGKASCIEKKPAADATACATTAAEACTTAGRQ